VEVALNVPASTVMIKAARFGQFSLAIALLSVGLSSCNKTPDAASVQAAAGDPANGNLAPADGSGGQPSNSQPAAQTAYAPVAQGTAPAQQAYQPAPQSSGYDQNSYSDNGNDQGSYAQTLEASQPPPPLPDYSQPECPGDNYIWTPGYWSYASEGYYWVPGAWVMAPWIDALWTPPYWGYQDDVYIWHTGYWGPHIGFYGGIDYGFGYTGRGYYGAYWNNGTVNYNRSVTNVNITNVHNVYNYPVQNNQGNRVSYNGGRGGLSARPTPQELAAVRYPRGGPVAAQVQHAQQAATNRGQFAVAGRAAPATLVLARPLATAYRAPAARPPAGAVAAASRPITDTRAQAVRPSVPGTVPQNRPEARPAASEARPAVHENVQENRPAPVAARPVPQARQEARPEVAAPRPAQQARQESRPTPAPRQESRPTPAPRQEARPAPAPRQEARPAAAPRQEARPAPAPHQEARPAPAPHQEARPAPAPRQEARPAPKPEEHKEH
jgi:hypothetical protein